ncbi:MAG: sugar phosphate nucleotidyltransferase [Tepidisphaeraceae bacterium]|jgi:UTP--glucose-1-phosphate uridylyltransferase
MKIKKAVVTAAGRGQRALPLQTLVDRDGQGKSALQIIIEEARSAEVDQIAIVISPGQEEAYAAAAGPYRRMLELIEQPSPVGYAHALYCAREFVGGEPFLHLVSDHLYISTAGQRCAQQLVELAKAESCSVSAVQATRESMLPYYGAVGGRRVAKHNHVYEIEMVLEKPTPTEAEQSLIIPGLRAGHYLCFFGMHVLTPGVMELLAEVVKNEAGLPLAAALDALARKERYLAIEVQGHRHNIGVKYGLLMAQLALALDGGERDEVLAQLVDLLAVRERDRK